MPIVTSQSSRAAATASTTVRWNARRVGDDVVGGERTHDDVLAGLRAPDARAPRPPVRSPPSSRAVTARRGRPRLRAPAAAPRTACSWSPAGHDQEPVLDQRRQPVVRLLEEGPSLAGEVVEELGRGRAGQRPEPGARTACRNHRPERVDRVVHHVETPTHLPVSQDPVTLEDQAVGPILGSVPTFAAVLAGRLRRDPGRPLVTFYDDETGERVELSVTTYANWVAKAGSLLVDELGLERGDTLRLDLPPHWLAPVFLGAAWSAGLVVTDVDDPTAVVCGPDRLDRWADEAAERVVLGCSLLPLGVRFAGPLPPGVHDVGVEIWSQPDAFTPWDPPSADDDAARPGRRPPYTSRRCGKRPPPGLSSPPAAASWWPRARLPHRSSRPLPSRSQRAAPSSWSPGPERSGSRRSTSPSTPPPASPPECQAPLEVVGLNRPGRTPARQPSISTGVRKPLILPGITHSWPVALRPGDQVAVAGQVDVVDAEQPV